MEAGLALGLTGAIALLVSYAQADEQRLTFWLSLGILTGLLMLCRLDEVFVSAAIGVAWLAWSPRQAIRRLPAVVALGLPPLLMLAGYLAYNLSYAGTAMPVSGAAKGEGALLQNGWVTLVTFFAPIIELRSLLTDYAASPQSLAGADFRVAQLVFPAVAAMCFVAAIAIHFRSAPWAPFVVGMCVAIVVKAAYNGLAVGYWHQASWYFAFAQGTISFTAALLLAPAVADWRDKSPLAVSLAAALIAAISFLQASQSYLGRSSQLPLTDRQRFFEAGPEINAAIEALTPGAKVLEFGDGLINFTLDRPVRHGFVFAGDLYSLEALQSGNLLQASYDDGYNVMTSFEYYRWPGITTDYSSDEIRQFLAQLGASYGIRGELINFEFEVIYVYEPLNIPFIKFEPL
jgi:hypothetical protein